MPGRSSSPQRTKATRRAAEIRAQREFVDQLSRNPATLSGDLDLVARLISESCSRLLGVERVGVWLFDETETELHCVDQYNLSSGAHASGAVIFEHELRDEFQALKSSLYVDASDPYTDPRTAGYIERYLRVNGITSMLDVVIRFGGKNLGTFCFEHVARPHAWEQHEIDFGCMVGNQLSLLLERRALQRAEGAKREIQDRLQATQEVTALQSRFLANVSHELRTPLTLLLGPLEDVLAGDGPPPSAWQREQLTLARRNAQRLLRLVDALLDFARAEADRLRAAFEPTDLAALTRSAACLFESAAKKAGLRLRVECEPTPEPAWVDRDMWERIVLNLVSNALKYTHAGEIAVALHTAGERFELVVRDTGIGIPADALPRLFEQFYRVPGARGRTTEGVGIGLALVKSLVALHAGTIHVESAPGRGTTFRVEIPRGHAHVPREATGRVCRALTPRASSPLVDEAMGWLARGSASVASPSLPAGAPAGTPGGARLSRVLVVDDNADMRAHLGRLLAGRYDVRAVADGEEALADVRICPPDLVLSDVMMPRLSGIELLRALRSDPATSTVPVILLSARAGEDPTVEALDAGADDYLFKPFSTRELRARVATHLALARARRDAAESALKDVFLGIAGHELRTPLTTLKLRLQVARRKLSEANPGEAARQLGQVDRAIARMEQLTTSLLTVSAIRSGRISLVRQRCDLAALCREVAEEEASLVERTVTLALPPEAIEAEVDRGRLGQAIGHLVSNALKYSPKDRPVTLSLRATPGEAVLAVHDEGPGIEGRDVQHLFERFYRVPGVEVQVGSHVGLGLGLFIARALVAEHGGRIDVETARGSGSTFVVRLPRVAGRDPCDEPAIR